jgi:two-component system OmpR family response regulator
MPDGDTGTHILVLDDDLSTRQMVSDFLADYDYRVTAVATGAQMSEVLEHERVDLLVLDLRLPGEDGMQIARRLRAESDLPIIVVTGRHDEADRVMALELGADDYVTKPFSPRELLARVRALLRRMRTHEVPPAPSTTGVRLFRFGGWQLTVALRRMTSPNGEQIPLSNSEFNLLVAFLGAPNRILSRSELLTLSRLHDDEVYDRSIDVQVARLRRKFDLDDTAPTMIRTERGLGYALNATVEAIR